jgi:hypothetical protein
MIKLKKTDTPGKSGNCVGSIITKTGQHNNKMVIIEFLAVSIVIAAMCGLL